MERRKAFETDNNSMHSLIHRNAEEPYSALESVHADRQVRDCFTDTFLITNQNGYHDRQEMEQRLHVYNDHCSLRIDDFDLLFESSSMKVLNTFYQKLCYLLSATFCQYSEPEMTKKVYEILGVFTDYFPNTAVSLSFMNTEDSWGRISPDINMDSNHAAPLFSFLKNGNITIQDFLLMKRYIVIVNNEEYQNMKFLHMINEDTILFDWAQNDDKHEVIHVNSDGVWQIPYEGLTFGHNSFRVLGTPEGKARYTLAASQCSNVNEVVSILQEIIPQLKSIGLPYAEYETDSPYLGWSESFLIPEDISLRDFILKKEYMIITYDEESLTCRELRKSKLWNTTEYPLNESLTVNFMSDCN